MYNAFYYLFVALLSMYLLIIELLNPDKNNICCCCCCLPTPPCLFGGVLPYFEVTGNPVPVSSQVSGLFHLELYLYCIFFKDERAIQGQLPKVLLHLIGVPDGGMGGRHS